MAEKTLTPTIDNSMDSYNPTLNYGTSASHFIGEYSGAVFIGRALIKFDIEGEIPAGSTINSATLRLTVLAGGDHSDNARTIRCYRSLRAWVHLESTWNIWKTGSNWTTAGAGSGGNDREAADIGTGTQPAAPNDYAEVDLTLTAAKIQEMLTGGGFTNNGFVIKVDTETDDMIYYCSANHATAGYRPELIVDYTPPATTSTSTTITTTSTSTTTTSTSITTTSVSTSSSTSSSTSTTSTSSSTSSTTTSTSSTTTSSSTTTLYFEPEIVEIEEISPHTE